MGLDSDLDSNLNVMGRVDNDNPVTSRKVPDDSDGGECSECHARKGCD